MVEKTSDSLLTIANLRQWGPKGGIGSGEAQKPSGRTVLGMNAILRSSPTPSTYIFNRSAPLRQDKEEVAYQDWQEFNARFISVNKSFYTTLNERYPALTYKDHKLCALIKLNFSSKEISLLLGISMESVNTARYRLRKKMGLNKDEDLSDIILKI